MTIKFRITNRDPEHKLVVRMNDKKADGSWSDVASYPLTVLSFGQEFEGHVWSTRRFIVEELDPKLEITA